jgi:hypothetical protein
VVEPKSSELGLTIHLPTGRAEYRADPNANGDPDGDVVHRDADPRPDSDSQTEPERPLIASGEVDVHVSVVSRNRLTVSVRGCLIEGVCFIVLVAFEGP